MLPEVWDRSVRVLTELVDVPCASISEAMLTQFLSKVSRRWPSHLTTFASSNFVLEVVRTRRFALLALSRLSKGRESRENRTEEKL